MAELRERGHNISTNRDSQGLKDGRLEVNGVQLYYITRGTGPHALLCIPGAIVTAQFSFSYQFEYFGNEGSAFTLVSYDLRGYGYSRPASRFDKSSNYYVTDAEDAHALMKMLGYNEYSVLAWCDGATSAMFMAAKYPTSIRSLIVWGARAFLTKEDTDRFEVLRDVSKWSPVYKVPLLKVYGELDIYVDLCTKFLEGLNEIRCRTNGAIIDEKELARISCPTLILHGANDPFVGPHQPEYIHDYVKKSQLMTFEDGKHAINLTHHQRFNKIVEQFLTII